MAPHSRKDIELSISAPHEGDKEIIFPKTLRQDRPSGLEEPGKVNWRFRVPDNLVIEFNDIHYGPQSFTTGVDFGDFLIWRGSDNIASYELAVVVDDHEMGVTEVVRGQDLLLSTAR